jgi:hypothetical protein
MIFSSLGTSKGQCDALDSNQSIISRRTLRVGREGRRLHTLRKCGASGPDKALRRAPQIFRQRAIGQCFCQMQPADLFRGRDRPACARRAARGDSRVPSASWSRRRRAAASAPARFGPRPQLRQIRARRTNAHAAIRLRASCARPTEALSYSKNQSALGFN